MTIRNGFDCVVVLSRVLCQLVLSSSLIVDILSHTLQKVVQRVWNWSGFRVRFLQMTAEGDKRLDVAGNQASRQLRTVPELATEEVKVGGNAGAVGCACKCDDVLGVVSQWYKEAANGRLGRHQRAVTLDVLN